MTEHDLEARRSALEMDPDEFRAVGHALVDSLADFWADPRRHPVTPGDDPERAWSLIGRQSLPEGGRPADEVLQGAFEALAAGSLLNGHPRFFGYITAGAAPIGVLAEMLAAGFNPNCGGWPLSPVASAIELQCVQWIAELTAYPADCGGLLCSGGNMANLLGYWAARARSPERKLALAPAATHTWIQKAADLSGTEVELVPCGLDERMDLVALARMARDKRPFVVVASGGTVSTGSVDDLAAVRKVCDEVGCWMHVDGAYGAFAACLPDAPSELRYLALADSVALDPHKWLYAPLEAGCALVRDWKVLYDAFSHRPPYYHFDREDSPEWCNFYELGVQNSRGFRALKVWAALQQAGRKGYVASIAQDVALARAMADYAAAQPEIEVRSCRLSIVTFRFVPAGLTDQDELNSLNERIVSAMQEGGEAFVSNAVVGGEYLLRACVVNFRTRLEDVRATVDLAVRLGRELHGPASRAPGDR
jgi:glutamate/tyrosine decarboxylase-like PLP-dependent enzyme